MLFHFLSFTCRRLYSTSFDRSKNERNCSVPIVSNEKLIGYNCIFAMIQLNWTRLKLHKDKATQSSEKKLPTRTINDDVKDI